MAQQVVMAPLVGDYLQNGKRLVMVLGIDREGRYEVEDCMTDLIAHIAVHELSSWQTVEKPGG